MRFIVVVGFLLVCLLPHAIGKSGPDVRIGLVGSLFRDIPDVLVEALKVPFTAVMREQTGLSGELVTVQDPLELGRHLEEGKLELGVFHGFEFAWAQQKYPRLKPLVIAINRHRHLSAQIIVSQKSPASSIHDLKGKHLAIPVRSREHSRLFFERLCREANIVPQQHFGKISTPMDWEEILDEVVAGKCDGVLIDGVALDSYQQLKLGSTQAFKCLHKSDIFPAAVIAYREGRMTNEILTRCADGLCTAHQNRRCRGMMVLWKLTAFELPPADYQDTLTNILKNYPSPESRTRQASQNTQPKTP